MLSNAIFGLKCKKHQPALKFKLNLNILKTYSTKSCGPVINLRNIGLLDNKHLRNGHLTTSTVIHQEHLPRSIECASNAVFVSGRTCRSPAITCNGQEGPWISYDELWKSRPCFKAAMNL